jgi:gas vesicle protein
MVLKALWAIAQKSSSLSSFIPLKQAATRIWPTSKPTKKAFPKRGWHKTPKKTLVISAIGAGASAAYLFDPRNGRQRRKQLFERIGAVSRKSLRKSKRLAAGTTAKAKGVAKRASHPQAAQSAPDDDQTLARKVESEVLGLPEIPKGQINVNAENGVIVLRGQARGREQINEIEDSVRKIPGVADVRNLLHTPGQAPPDRGPEKAITQTQQQQS